MGAAHPHAPRPTSYAIFQDDVLAVKNLREYIDARFPRTEDHNHVFHDELTDKKAYLNLYTFLNNEQVIAQAAPVGWHEGSQLSNSNPLKQQRGRSALGLVFSPEGLRTLLGAPTFVNKPAASERATVNLDGAVATAMNAHGWREWIHNPTLLHHTGLVSSLRTRLHGETTMCPFPPAESWRGEDCDAMEFLAEMNV